MWSVSIIVLLPGRDLLPGVRQRREQVFVQKLISETAVERLDECVLHWLTGSDVMPVDLGFLTPSEYGHTGRSVPLSLTDNGLGPSSAVSHGRLVYGFCDCEALESILQCDQCQKSDKRQC